jgi:hypothetical protein
MKQLRSVRLLGPAIALGPPQSSSMLEHGPNGDRMELYATLARPTRRSLARTLRLSQKRKAPFPAPFAVAGQDLNLRPPGYEPPRLGTRVPPYSA